MAAIDFGGVGAKPRFRRRLAGAAVLALAAILALAVYSIEAGRYSLLLMAAQGDEVFVDIGIKPGDGFSVSFVHSVNNSPVTDVYRARTDGIYLVGTEYYAFGAGVPSDLEPGQSLAYAEDGAMVISGIDRKMTDLVYVVSTVSDHVMSVGGQELSLRALCGRNSAVRFTLARGIGPFRRAVRDTSPPST